MIRKTNIAAVNEVVEAIDAIRLTITASEMEIHQRLMAALLDARILCRHEVALAPRQRADILTNDGVLIEVKRRRPSPTALLAQVQRYASSELVNAIVIVVDDFAHGMPDAVEGKPVRYISLHSLWGVAI